MRETCPLPRMPEISIIVPCYNGEKTIENCLDSILRQSCQDFEVILVDDASRDGTRAVMENYLQNHRSMDARIVCHDINQGVSKSRNDGLAMAKGTFVSFLDSDDVLDCDFCKTLLEAAAKEEDVDIVCGNVDLHTPDGRRRKQFRTDRLRRPVSVCPENDIRFYDVLHFLDISCAKLFRRSLLESHNILFDKELRFAEDTLFSCTAAIFARRIVVLPDYCGYTYLLQDTSCSVSMEIPMRLDSLKRFLMELDRILPSTMRRMLLRKSLEYVWTIKKFGGIRRQEFLERTMNDRDLLALLDSSIRQFGGFKHRIVWSLIRHGISSSLVFW